MPRRPLRPPPARLIRTLYAIGLGPLIGRVVLLLTTTGRKSGLPRTTPLQYERVEAAIVVASATGTRADWFRNLQACPRVHVRIGSRAFDGLAQPVTDPVQIADFVELRLRRHPRLIGAILAAEGLTARPSRAALEDYARRLAMAIIRPEQT